MSHPPVLSKPATEGGTPRLVAVIDIGATSIRMAIAEIDTAGEVRTLDTLVQSVELGREVFDNQRISRKSIEKSASILKRYQRVLQEYGITSPSDVRVVATTAVREANNQVAFADRIFVATGFNVVPIDEAEVNRITYMGVVPDLQAHEELADGKSLVVEVGGGNTEMLVIRSGNVLHSQSYRLGSLRLLNTLDGVRASASRRRSILESHIRRTIVQISEEIEDETSINVIALGGDIRFAAHQLLEDWDAPSSRSCQRNALRNSRIRFWDLMKTRSSSVTARVLSRQRLWLPPCSRTRCWRSIFRFPMSSFAIPTCATECCMTWRLAVDGRLSSVTKSCVRRFHLAGNSISMKRTPRNVAELARKLFDQLGDEHKLDSRHEVILFVAALLYEIGLIVNVRSNHKHALYLIRFSDLFGLSQDELLLVGLVARYYRRAFPQPSHEGYGTLRQEDRVVVAKLASILRLAIALDDTRSGRVREIECVADAKQLVINVPGVDDVSLEQIAMRENSGLFHDVFGMPVLLRAGK